MSIAVKSPCDEGIIRSGPPGPASDAFSPTVGRLVLLATILGSSMAFIDGTVVNVALPTLQRDFDATAAGVQWVVQAYSLFLAALILVGGSLGDRYGRRRIFAVGVVVFTIASVACGAALNLDLLVVSRAGEPGDHLGDIPGRGTRPGDRHLVRVHRDHLRDRTGPRWLDGRASFVALGVPDERPIGGDRAAGHAPIRPGES
jgi:hypothetical protein